MPSGRHPNIVFIHAESMDGRKMGCMGHPAMRNATPNLDGLAEDGVLFRNAYTNCPVCNPSRASMWTGKYPHYRDCWNNHEGLREGTPTFRDVLDSAGYRTAAVGPLDYAYGMHSIRDRVGSWTRSACVRRPISRTPMPKIVADGECNQRDWRWTCEALTSLQEAASDERPFMLYLTTGLVHPAFVSDPKHMAMIDASEIDIPPTLKPLGSGEHPVIDYMRITKNCDKRFSEAVTREIRHIYFSMIAALDELVGAVLRALADMGLDDSTYVIFSSDHGEMAGEQNQILKRSMFEPSNHVPLIVRGPGVRRGATVDTPVSLIDLYPTLMDMAGVRHEDFGHIRGLPETVNGESVMPQLAGGAERERDWAFCEYNGDRCCTGTYMLRRGDWKYVKYVGYPSQLFNLAEDPWEARDLADERPEVARELDGLLAANFDCEAIDARAKQYDKESFRPWREARLADGTYRDTMAQIYSGFDRLCIEDIVPWSDEDEARVEAWSEE